MARRSVAPQIVFLIAQFVQRANPLAIGRREACVGGTCCDGGQRRREEKRAPRSGRGRRGASISSSVTRTIQRMDDLTSWDDEDLLRALDRYEKYLSTLGLSPATVDIETYYSGRFLDWRTGDPRLRRIPAPIARPVPAGKRDLAGLRLELGQYEAFLPNGVKPTAVPRYVRPPRGFLDWLGGKLRRGKLQPTPPHKPPRGAATITSPRSAGLADEFARVRDGHRAAIVRTVARMTLLPSVTRVFEKGTTKPLTGSLVSLPVDELPELTDQADYRRWFEEALDRVATTILDRNPHGPRSKIHPGYKWGHGTKVLSLFARNLVLCSRYFTDEEARRIERWFYCPIDGIVMKRLRRVGFDPGARSIREIDEATFWRIQDCLSITAEKVGIPRVWFDDVWSEDRD